MLNYKRRMILVPQPRRLSMSAGTVRAKAAIDESIVADPDHPGGYELSIEKQGIRIVASDASGAFYARQTLAQITRQFPDQLPCLRIEDWPDFPTRGVMLDISRDKVPTMATLFAILDQLAELKINQLQLYTEHTFAYRAHQTVWKDASPMTADEIRQLEAYCRERFIELVPNQNSFGHLERWFKHPQYHHLAEQPDGFVFPWGNRMPTGFSLNPTDPKSMEFVESLFDELLPNFQSKLFNIGCDETYDVGLGRSKDEVERRGRERVYLDFVLKIYKSVKRRGRTMMFWGDIILHKPELLGELPRDLIALNWGYEADHPFEKETRAFRDAEIPFYVCPGTSSWCSISGRSDNALTDLKNAAVWGLANGAIGYLITDWGDHGHLQYLPISYLGFAAGAAYSWCYESNKDLSIADALDVHIFKDQAKIMGRLMHDFGNIAKVMNEPLANATRLFWTLINGEDRKKLYENVKPQEYRNALRAIDDAVASLDQAQMQRDDAPLIQAEVRNAANMLRHACKRGCWLREPSSHNPNELADELVSIVNEHRRLWRARNREGGLSDSCAKLERIINSYSISKSTV